MTLDTIYRWRERTKFEDRSHTSHQMATTLTPAHAAVVIELRRMPMLQLDNLWPSGRHALVSQVHVSLSSLDRRLRRNGISNLNVLRLKTLTESHRAYEPGYLYVEVKYLSHLLDQ